MFCAIIFASPLRAIRKSRYTGIQEALYPEAPVCIVNIHPFSAASTRESPAANSQINCVAAIRWQFYVRTKSAAIRPIVHPAIQERLECAPCIVALPRVLNSEIYESRH
jgi:hypothetical protein